MPRRVMRADGVVVLAGPDGRPPPPPTPPICRFRGGPTSDTLPSRGPGQVVRLPLVSCAVHGQAVLYGQAASAWSCAHCGDHELPVRPWVWDVVPGLPDPLPEAPLQPMPPDWRSRSAVRQRHIDALGYLAHCHLPPPPPFSGDGIVTLGEGRYWPMILVQLRMIREVSRLPVRVYYRPWGGDVAPDAIRDLGAVELVPLPSNPPPRRSGGWECKTVAVIDCPWERVLYLDADAYPVADVGPLFDTVSAECPFAYWGDIHAQRFTVSWSMCGLPPCPSVRSVQGGHLLLHRGGAWRLLAVANFLNQHSEYFYSAGFGDQDMWRIGLALLGTPHQVIGETVYHGAGAVVGLAGQAKIVHRINCKMWGEPGDASEERLPREAIAWAHREAVLRPGSPATASRDAFVPPEVASRPGTRLKECWYPPEQLQALRYVAAKPAARYLAFDLGCWTGSSTAALAELYGQVVAVDRWRQVVGGPSDYDESEAAYALWRERMKAHPNVTALRLDHRVAVEVLDGPVDLVHLDGDHGLGAVAEQIAWARRVVRPGGIICGHDLDNPHTPGVRQAVEAAFGRDWSHASWVWWHQVPTGSA